MRRGYKGILMTGWAAPRYKPIKECRVMEHARGLLLHIIYLLERLERPTSEIEVALFSFRMESIAGLNYQTDILEAELGIEKEVKVGRVKRTSSAKSRKEKKSKIKRGGFFI